MTGIEASAPLEGLTGNVVTQSFALDSPGSDPQPVLPGYGVGGGGWGGGKSWEGAKRPMTGIVLISHRGSVQGVMPPFQTRPSQDIEGTETLSLKYQVKSK